MTLTKDILIEVFSSKTGISLQKSKEILEILLEEIKASLIRGDNVKVTGFGRWSVREKRARKVKNPNNQELIQILARKVVTFSVSSKLRETINESKHEKTEKA